MSFSLNGKKSLFLCLFFILCSGDWAGASSVWNAAQPGMSKSCAAMTGYSTCTAYVLAQGAAFASACTSSLVSPDIADIVSRLGSEECQDIPTNLTKKQKCIVLNPLCRRCSFT
jgi:hypothetical protein